VAALAVALNKRGPPGWPGLGEDHVDFEAFCPVRDVGLPITRLFQKALADIPFDVEFVHVSPVLYFTPRDEDVSFVTGSVLVHRRAGGAAVVEEDFAISPGLVLVGDDVVLQVAHLFSFLESGSLSSPVLQFERRFVFEHLVHAFIRPALRHLPHDLPRLSQHVQPGQSQ